LKILAHTSFIGTTGYANHARSFFCSLNKHHTVKVRNLTIGDSWKGHNYTPHDGETYITEEMKQMLVLQSLYDPDGKLSDDPMYSYDKSFIPDVHIVLVEMNNEYFYDDYEGYKIAYNVWESTRYPDDFFIRLFYFDEVWVPTQWQFDSLVEQGYPSGKIRIVPEGVDVDTFKPIKKIPKREKFRFLLFGRWDYRKSTTEIIRTFGETFKGNNDVELICSVENPYPSDGFKSTQERIEHHGTNYDNVKYINFVSRQDYIKMFQEGHVFLSCARSEGWNLPLIEAMACGIPSIYSDWGGQLQFAQGKGVPVKISHLRQANICDVLMPGEYCEPDFSDLSVKLMDVYENYEKYRTKALKESDIIHKEFNWESIGEQASQLLNKSLKPFVFVTCGNLNYMGVIEKLVQSILEFSSYKIMVYGIDCDVPFDYPNVIKRRLDITPYSEHDKWYWKQYACIDSINSEFDNFVWIDGDVVVNHNIDNIKKHFKEITNYPIPDVHVQEEFFGLYNDNQSQLFNENLSKFYNVEKKNPYSHICFYVYNENCKWWFEQIINIYKSFSLKDYKKYLLWNDEGIDNYLRWEHNATKFLPLSNFDTSSYDGDDGITQQTLHQFYKYWIEYGPQNFNRIFGFQYIPKDKNQILYFHGNKNSEISDRMIEYIKMIKDKSFYKSHSFFVGEYQLVNFDHLIEYQGSTLQVAEKFGWSSAIYHEIYNLRDYYNNREKRINNGDIVVDLGGNIGVFNRWAYTEGAGTVISFEPDRRYYKLLSLNADPRSILFNAAVSDKVGEMDLFESEHLGGSNLFGTQENAKSYKVRTYTLDYLFESKLIDHIDFLKIDIEGSEIYALNGISNENLMKVKTIAIEYHHCHFDYNESLRQGIIDRMLTLGFNSYLLYLGGNDNLQMIYFTR
jgi:FkbM family methyltransferase